MHPDIIQAMQLASEQRERMFAAIENGKKTYEFFSQAREAHIAVQIENLLHNAQMAHFAKIPDDR